MSGSIALKHRGKGDLKLRALLLSAVFCAAVSGASHAAEPVTSFTVLSPDDVKLYGQIFAAEKSGQIARADALSHKLSDQSLLGFVLEERYLAPHYHSKFSELKSWLEQYGDLPGRSRFTNSR